MHKDATSIQKSALRVLLWVGLLLLVPYGKEEAFSAQTETAHALPSSPDDPPPPFDGLSLPLSFERHTGDLDVMAKRRTIRALVIIDPIGFFYEVSGFRHQVRSGEGRVANDEISQGNFTEEIRWREEL
jgi:hypothetical protein